MRTNKINSNTVSLDVVRNAVLDEQYKLHDAVTALVELLPEEWFIGENKLDAKYLSGVVVDIVKPLFFEYNSANHTDQFITQTLETLGKTTNVPENTPALHKLIKGVWQKLRDPQLLSKLDATAQKEANKKGSPLDNAFSLINPPSSAFGRIALAYCSDFLTGKLTALIRAHADRLAAARLTGAQNEQLQKLGQDKNRVAYDLQEERKRAKALEAEKKQQETNNQQLSSQLTEKEQALLAEKRKAQEAGERAAVAEREVEAIRREKEQSDRARRAVEQEKHRLRIQVERHKDQEKTARENKHAAQENQVVLVQKIKAQEKVIAKAEQAKEQLKSLQESATRALARKQVLEEKMRTPEYQARVAKVQEAEAALLSLNQAIEANTQELEQYNPLSARARESLREVIAEAQQQRQTLLEERDAQQAQLATEKRELDVDARDKASCVREYEGCQQKLKKHKPRLEKAIAERQSAKGIKDELMRELSASIKKYGRSKHQEVIAFIKELKAAPQREEVPEPTAPHTGNSAAEKSRIKVIQDFARAYPKGPHQEQAIQAINALENINAVDDHGRPLLLSLIDQLQLPTKALAAYVARNPDLGVWQDMRGATQLHYVVRKGAFNAIKIVLDYAADAALFTRCDHQGNSLLHALMESSLQERDKKTLIELLKAKGVAPLLQNKNGKSPRDLAPFALKDMIAPAPVVVQEEPVAVPAPVVPQEPPKAAPPAPPAPPVAGNAPPAPPPPPPAGANPPPVAPPSPPAPAVPPAAAPKAPPAEPSAPPPALPAKDVGRAGLLSAIQGKHQLKKAETNDRSGALLKKQENPVADQGSMFGQLSSVLSKRRVGLSGANDSPEAPKKVRKPTVDEWAEDELFYNAAQLASQPKAPPQSFAAKHPPKEAPKMPSRPLPKISFVAQAQQPKAAGGGFPPLNNL